MNIHSYYGNLLSFNEILLLGMSNYFLSNRSKEIICLQKETENSSKTSNRACLSQGNCVIYLAHSQLSLWTFTLSLDTNWDFWLIQSCNGFLIKHLTVDIKSAELKFISY